MVVPNRGAEIRRKFTLVRYDRGSCPATVSEWNHLMSRAASLLLLLLLPTVALAGWPMYRADATRGGYTAETLPKDLHEQWRFRLPHRPEPAWPRDERMPFDRAPQVVVSGNRALFGGTVDGKLYAVDPATGETAWTFTTEAPIRFAPAIWRDRAFCASDDGNLYALALADGKLLWKRRGGPDGRMILGNERLISKWPARGGPAVVGNTVYFAAGIWPSDGIFLYALDCESGAPQWTNDDSGSIYMPQPHGGANARSGVSAQGYLVASGEKLFVPTGRAVPAAFERATGKFLFFHLQKFGHNGGAPTMAVGDLFFNSGLGFSASSGERSTSVGVGQLAATPHGLIRHTGATIAGFRWTEKTEVDRKGQKQNIRALAPLWEVGGVPAGQALIATKSQAIAAGKGQVTLVDAEAKQAVWSATFEGAAYGLAVSDGRLFVSTDAGEVICYAAGKPTPNNGQPAATAMYPDNQRYAEAAEEILAKAKITDGYCVDLGCGDGALAYELARRTNLRIYAVEEDPALAAAARKKLTAAGVYGQVIVHQRAVNATGYPKYFADLIVSRRQWDAAAKEQPFELPAKQVRRIQRPCGGTVCQRIDGKLEVDVRDPLPGAGQWTHQYASAANTLNSGDPHVRGRLGMLWFRDVAIDIPQRHGRAPAPLYSNGRLFHQGIDGIVAVDAYNGRELWRYDIPGVLKAYDGDELMGAAGTGSNFCLGENGVFIRDGERCLRLNPANGRLDNEYRPPKQPDGKPGNWGYIAQEGELLYGTVANQDHIVTYRYVNRGGDMKRLLTESHSLFAMEPDSGKIAWQYDAKHSIRHNAIAIGGGRVFLIDRPLALHDRQKKASQQVHPTGELVCLDAKTGKELWRNREDIYGTLLAFSGEHESLLMSYQPTRFRLDSEIGGKMAVFDARTGKRRWDQAVNYQSRPMINGDVIYAQGGAWELLTGKTREFDFSRSYGCGVLSGSKHMMFFRSATLGYYDLAGKKETENYGGVRPGCWINAIPAGGIVMAPDASSGCRCSYLNKTWLALDSDPRTEPEIEPAGGAWPTPVEAKIVPDPEAEVVRYTLDGSTPTEKSPVYDGPVKIGESATLKARSFYADGSGSLTTSAEFQIDPNLIPLADSAWDVWDVSGAGVSSAPSAWKVVGAEVVQSSNIFEGSASAASPTDRRFGTLRILKTLPRPLADGSFELEIMSKDNDGLGAAFRVQAPDKLYLFGMDAQRKFQILAVRNGDDYRVLAKNTLGYTPGRWHKVRLEARGEKLAVYVDGQKTLEATDKTFASGSIALYSWGNSGSYYRALKLAK